MLWTKFIADEILFLSVELYQELKPTLQFSGELEKAFNWHIALKKKNNVMPSISTVLSTNNLSKHEPIIALKIFVEWQPFMPSNPIFPKTNRKVLSIPKYL